MKSNSGDVNVSDGVVNGQPVYEQHHTGSDNDQSNKTEPPRLPAAEHAPPNGNQHRPRRQCYVRFEWPKLALEILTLIVIIYYACQAARQADASRDAANAARDAAIAATISNDTARINAHDELRAYLSLGDTKGKWITLEKSSVTFYLYNAGRTPAQNLLFEFDDTGRGGTIHHIEKIAETKGPFAGTLIRTHSGIDVAGNSVVRVKEPLRGKLLPQHGYTGHFEYCDVFQRWHCDTFQVRYLPDGTLSYDSLARYLLCPKEGSEGSAYISEVARLEGPNEAKNYKTLNPCDPSD